ncbi:hypothetical protein [endosymbiont DhMRE of Dentiscutata heterogama]|uniref:hypothetical protein n=1 Tax=endosymbiont DhMRE of Dentiscutata heterogama TaxID=1609546 RepID=UPI002AD488B1|nr:hypothetical protein [endosymbiont DhMRE of Dentiscutata heterogama]
MNYLLNKEPNFIYDPQKSEWKTIFVPLTKKRQQELAQANKSQGWKNNNKNTSTSSKAFAFPYTFNRFKQAKSTNQYKITKPSRIKQNYK